MTDSRVCSDRREVVVGIERRFLFSAWEATRLT